MEAASVQSGIIAENASDQLFLLGRDIAHSLSPLLQNAAMLTLGLPWTYGLRDEAAAEDARAFIESRAFRAINVTTPYKALALECADRVEKTNALCASIDAAGFEGVDIERLAAAGLPGANVLINDASGLAAYNTDGEGARLSLESEEISFGASRVLVCGTGVTAHAIARAAKFAGASDVHMLSRTTCAEGIVRYDEARDLFAASDIVINATPVGMCEADTLPFCEDWLKSDHVVLDAVYGHGDTPFARAAKRVGCRFFDGQGMLVCQAALTLLLVITHARASQEITHAPQTSFDDIRSIMTDALQDCHRAAHAVQ